MDRDRYGVVTIGAKFYVWDRSAGRSVRRYEPFADRAEIQKIVDRLNRIDAKLQGC